MLFAGQWTQRSDFGAPGFGGGGFAGLQYLRARWYDPRHARFTRLDPFLGDPADPRTLHKYAYTAGQADPVNFVDPSGEFALGEVGVANTIRLAITEATAAVGIHAQTAAQAASSGASLNQILITSLATASVGGLAGAGISAGLGISVKAGRLVFSKASGGLFENFATRRFAQQVLGETVIRTKFLRGNADRGIDFASVQGRGVSAKLIINEVKNVRGRIPVESFSAFGVNRRATWLTNLQVARRAIDRSDLDAVTKDVLIDQLERRDFLVRVIVNGDKNPNLPIDLMARVRQATNVDQFVVIPIYRQ